MTPNEALQAHYLSLSITERGQLTRKLGSQLGVTANTIFNWRYSRTKLKPIYCREINRILGKDIFADCLIS